MIIQHVLIVSSTCPGVLLLQPSVGVQQRDLCTQAAAGKQCPWPNNHPLSPGFGSYIHSAFHGILILSYLTPFTLPELLDLSYNVSKCHIPHPKNTDLHRTGCMLSLKVVLHNFLTSPEHRPQPNIAKLYEFKCCYSRPWHCSLKLSCKRPRKARSDTASNICIQDLATRLEFGKLVTIHYPCRNSECVGTNNIDMLKPQMHCSTMQIPLNIQKHNARQHKNSQNMSRLASLLSD